MNDPTAFPPPRPPESLPGPTSTEPTEPTEPNDQTEPSRFAHPVALFAVAVGIATSVAIALGIGIGFVAFSVSASSCTPSDGWCDLGAALIGVAFGGVSGMIAYIIAGVVVISRFRPSGRRAAHIAAHIASPFALIAILQLVAILADTLR